MKKNTLISILILMMCLSLSAKFLMNSEYSEYNNDHKLDYHMKYIKYWERYIINFEQKYQKANNKTFNQVNETHEVKSNFNYKYNNMNQGVTTRYKRLFEHYPAYHINGDIEINDYEVGYFFHSKIVDSLNVNGRIKYSYEREDNPDYSKEIYNNHGYNGSFSSVYQRRILNNDININAVYNYTNRDYDYKNGVVINFDHGFEYKAIEFYNQVNYIISQTDIFTKNIDGLNFQSDSQNKRDFIYRTQVYYEPVRNLYLDFQGNFINANNRMDVKSDKSSKTFNFDGSFGVTYFYHDWIELFSTFKIIDDKKDFNNSETNRKSKEQKVDYGFTTSMAYLDTISFQQTCKILSTDYPNMEVAFNSDYVTNITSFKVKKMFSDVASLSNMFKYSTKEEIYLDGKYSKSNKKKTSYIINPKVDYFVGDNMLFSQNYTLKIDYDDYIYDKLTYNPSGGNTLEDKYFRQATAEFSFRFDNSPMISKGDIFYWKLPRNLLKNDNNINLKLNYKFYANETGTLKSSNYDVKDKNIKHELYLLAEKNYQGINIKFKPMAYWGTKEIYEFTGILGYNNNSEMEFLLNVKPRYEVYRHDWILAVETKVSLRF